MAWIGVISAGVVTLFGTTTVTGWIIAGGLFAALVVGMFVISREVKRAVELPDECLQWELAFCAESPRGSSKKLLRSSELPISRMLVVNRGTMVRSYNRTKHRRVRTRQNRPRVTKV